MFALWQALPKQVGNALILVGGVIAAFAVARSRGNPWYALVFCWALLAICFRGGQEAQAIAIACAVSAAAVLLAAGNGLRLPANRRRWLG